MRWKTMQDHLNRADTYQIFDISLYEEMLCHIK